MADLALAYCLWFFFGVFGFHRFYLGQPGMGILYFFTFGLFGIGWLIDFCLMPALVDDYNRQFQPNVIVVGGQAPSANIIVQNNNSSVPQYYPPPPPQQGYQQQPYYPQQGYPQQQYAPPPTY